MNETNNQTPQPANDWLGFAYLIGFFALMFWLISGWIEVGDTQRMSFAQKLLETGTAKVSKTSGMGERILHMEPSYAQCGSPTKLDYNTFRDLGFLQVSCKSDSDHFEQSFGFWGAIWF